jgi:hypothetical protein
MAIALILLASIFIIALGLRAYKQIKLRQQKRMAENEYNTAVMLWNYAVLVKGQIEEAMRGGEGVLEFSKIAVPHSEGYKVSLELAGSAFRVYAAPAKYNRTGRLSFFTDDTLTVRAADHGGAQATAEDAEYQGELAA